MKVARLVSDLESTGFLVGIIGFLLLIAGIACVYWPAGLIAAGLLMLAWSAMAAQASARVAHAAKHNKEG